MIPMVLITLMMLMMLMMLIMPVMLVMAPMLALGHGCCLHAGIAADGGGELGGKGAPGADGSARRELGDALLASANCGQEKLGARGVAVGAQDAWANSGRRGAWLGAAVGAGSLAPSEERGRGGKLFKEG